MTRQTKNIWRLLFVIASLIGAVAPCAAQPMTPEKILQNVKAVSDRVKDYSAVLTASIHMERLKIPEMKVQIYFKQPDKLHIESKGFSMLPREGIFLNPSRLLEKFVPTLLSTEKNGATTEYVIQLTPRADRQTSKRKMSASKIRVDGSRWLVTKLESATQAGGVVSVEFRHTQVAGSYWLPEQISAEFDVPSRKDDSVDDQAPRRQSGPLKGSVLMVYSEYKVNAGLDDALFEPKKVQKDQ